MEENSTGLMGDDLVDLGRVTAERDLYLRLLGLAHEKHMKPFLRESLALIVELAGARQGYLEIYDEASGSKGARWSIAHGFSAEDLRKVRTMVSRGIISEALASAKTIATPSALLDPRFSDRESVRLGRIEAVLCVPIGEDPPRGVLYLQGRAGSGLFSDEECTRAELVARQLAPLADRFLLQEQERIEADPTARVRETLHLEGVIGRSPALAKVLRQVELVAPLDVSILLTGESGTGKSQLARLIHDHGPRAASPFVELNCAAIPEALVESEMFGAFPGAHSTATKRVEGKVAAAERGTLFLDEIGEISLGVQAKLLQLLQSKEYYPLGSPKAVRADVRVIAATNTDLTRAVAERRFREELFYRLQVVPLRVPSLSERKEDIAELAGYFGVQACERHRLPYLELSRNALRAIESVEWPGNVRQLAHAVEAAVIRAAGEGARQVERVHLFPEEAGKSASSHPTFQDATRRFQAGFLRDTLEQTGWNVIETARRLDLARSTVYNLIRAFGLEREDL